MMLKMFSVKDLTAAFFFPPFFVRSNVEATRIFERLLNDPSRTGAVSEYSLFFIGEFDDQTGVTVVVNPEQMANGADFTKE